MSVFKLNLPKQTVISPYFMPVEVEDISPLDKAVYDFAEMYGLQVWEIVLGNQHFKTWIDDIAFFWDELPEKLCSIMSGMEKIVEIDTVSQGSEKLIGVHSYEEEGEEIEVTIISCEDTEDFYYACSDYRRSGQKVDKAKFPTEVVNRSEFVNEWKAFIENVITQVIENNLISDTDDSISEFKARLP